MKKYITFFILIILISFNSYSAWRKITNITPRNLVDQYYLDVMFLKSNPNYGWACGHNGVVIRTTDGGKSWFGQQLIPGAQIQLESIHFVNEKVGYVSGPVNSGYASSSVIFKTTDGGITWNDITHDRTNAFWGLYFVDENNGVLLGGDCGFQIFWKTTNGGQTWSYTTNNIANSKLSDAIIYEKDGLGYAVGSGTFWITTNGGSNWRLLSTTGGGDWHEDIAISGNTVLLPISLGCDGNTQINNGGIAISNDLGKTWRRFSTSKSLFGTFLLDEQNGWAVGLQRNVYYTTDAGKTWNEDNCGIPSSADVDDIFFLDYTTGWAVGTGIYEYFIPEYPEPKLLTESLFICEGDTTNIEIIGKFDRVIWNTGDTTRKIYITKPGEYFARVFVDSICYTSLTQKIKINYYPKIDVKFSIPDNSIFCQGDTITLEVVGAYLQYNWEDGNKDKSRIITESGKYVISVIDSNGCLSVGSLNVIFNKPPEPKIKNLYKDIFCIGDEAELITEKNYSKYEWYEKDENNVISTDKKLKVQKTGSYYVKVTDEYGCIGISDIKNIIVKDDKNAIQFILETDNNFIIDSTLLKFQKCGNLKILNTKDTVVIIDEVYLFKNINFSCPLSQFPLVLAPKSETNLKVCFSPNNLGIAYDTLLIYDICKEHIIPLQSFGISDKSTGNSKCEVPLIFEAKEVKQSFKATISNPYPNPTNDNLSLDIDLLLPINSNINYDIKIIDFLGNVNNNYYLNKTISSISKDVRSEIWKIQFDLSKFESGIYYLLIFLQDNKVTFPIIVNR